MLDFNKLVLGPTIATFGEVNQGYPIPLFSPDKGEDFTADGVFDEAYREHVIKDGEAVTVTMPVLGIKVADCPILPVQDDNVVIRGQTYIIREVRVDGHGGAKLMLNFQTDYESP